MAYLLIVDDDLDYAQALKTVLQTEGHEVALESDAEKVVERIQERRPEAIVLDVMFPEDPTAGFKVARAIRQKFGNLPVLMLTSASQRLPGGGGRGIDFTTLPATEFMEKPIDFKSLSRVVGQIVAAGRGEA